MELVNLGGGSKAVGVHGGGRLLKLAVELYKSVHAAPLAVKLGKRSIFLDRNQLHRNPGSLKSAQDISPLFNTSPCTTVHSTASKS